MTYVEFFDKMAVENVIACLTDVPERVIFLGDNAKLMQKHIEKYQKVFADRGRIVEFCFRTVSRSNLENAVAVLSKIVETCEDCAFDITGGEEILTLALGIVCERHPEKKIQIHRFNIKSGAVYDCDKDGVTIYKDTPVLSVDENVRLYGGEVSYGGINDTKTYKWDLTPAFQADVSRIWSVCRRNVRAWNKQCGFFSAMEEVGAVSGDGLVTTASRYEVEKYLKQNRASGQIVKGIVSDLCRYGLVRNFAEDGRGVLTVSYKNAQVKKCLVKAGQALEMHVFVTACALREADGSPVYDDARNGVLIDWDGSIPGEEGEVRYDTENEIDVLLMHGIVPVFISCKNGFVASDELYKLDSVARRFGGRYAKKVLVATALDTMGKAGEYLRQRARDMDIRLLENIQTMTDGEFARKIKTLWST